MFSEADYDKLISPIIGKQTKLELDVFSIIVNKLYGMGNLSPTDLYALFALAYDTTELNNILSMIDTFMQNQEVEIQKLLNLVAQDTYISSKRLFDSRNIKFIPFKDNIPVRQIVSSISERTMGEMRNLSRTTAFQIRKPGGILVDTPVSMAYQDIIDKAVQSILTGDIDRNKATENAIAELTASGLRAVTYNTESGLFHTKRLDSAVKSNIFEGIQAINQGIQDEVGQQIGADGKEISVHQFPAADHAPIQGHQFTNEEYAKLQSGQDFQDVKGNKFNAIRRSIGKWNCRHHTWSVFLDIQSPLYTDEQLDEILRKNEEGYTTATGRHLTLYQCSQVQRDYELRIRKADEARKLADSVGDTELSRMYENKTNELIHEYMAFSKDCGLPPRLDNLRL